LHGGYVRADCALPITIFFSSVPARARRGRHPKNRNATDGDTNDRAGQGGGREPTNRAQCPMTAHHTMIARHHRHDGHDGHRHHAIDDGAPIKAAEPASTGPTEARCRHVRSACRVKPLGTHISFGWTAISTVRLGASSGEMWDVANLMLPRAFPWSTSIYAGCSPCHAA
jgi:hypothetical protein